MGGVPGSNPGVPTNKSPVKRPRFGPLSVKSSVCTTPDVSGSLRRAWPGVTHPCCRFRPPDLHSPPRDMGRKLGLKRACNVRTDASRYHAPHDDPSAFAPAAEPPTVRRAGILSLFAHASVHARLRY